MARIFVAAFMVLGLLTTDAVASPSTGKINRLEFANAGNYPFRMYITGVSILCTGGSNFAYLDVNNANYQSYVAAAISAYLAGKTVTTYTNLVAGQCQIDNLAVYD